MADLVRQHAEHHLVVVGEFDQFVGEHDRPVRQRKGVRPDQAALAEIERVGRSVWRGCRRGEAARRQRCDLRESRSVSAFCFSCAEARLGSNTVLVERGEQRSWLISCGTTGGVTATATSTSTGTAKR